MIHSFINSSTLLQLLVKADISLANAAGSSLGALSCVAIVETTCLGASRARGAI